MFQLICLTNHIRPEENFNRIMVLMTFLKVEPDVSHPSLACSCRKSQVIQRIFKRKMIKTIG